MDEPNQEPIEEQEKVLIYSAYKLSEDEIEMVRKKIPLVKDLEIENVIDKTVIAGLIVKTGSIIYDLSLRNQLQKLKKFIYEAD